MFYLIFKHIAFLFKQNYCSPRSHVKGAFSLCFSLYRILPRCSISSIEPAFEDWTALLPVVFFFFFGDRIRTRTAEYQNISQIYIYISVSSFPRGSQRGPLGPGVDSRLNGENDTGTNLRMSCRRSISGFMVEGMNATFHV